MIAKDLKEAAGVLNPTKSLSTPEELIEFFVERPDSPLDNLKITLEDSTEHEKILFTGHRGSGKSTELNKLAIKLEDEFFIIKSSVSRHLDFHDLNYVDVVLSLGLELIQKLIERNVAINPDAKRTFEDFTKEISIGIEVEDKEGGGTDLGAGVDYMVFAADLTSKFKREHATRTAIRKNLGSRLNDLFTYLDILAREVEKNTGQRVLAIVEDLDKVDLTCGKTLFSGHSTSLVEPKFSIIYTFPIELCFEKEFKQIQNSFSRTEVLPNLKTHHKDDSLDDVGVGKLKEILIKRIDEGLFTSESLEMLAYNSGGVPRELIRLCGYARTDARQKAKTIIDEQSVNIAIHKVRMDYERQLKGTWMIPQLQSVRVSKWLVPLEQNKDLLQNLSALEYRNERVWYDVNPIILPLLTEDKTQ
jgi:hypothetical protein